MLCIRLADTRIRLKHCWPLLAMSKIRRYDVSRCIICLTLIRTLLSDTFRYLPIQTDTNRYKLRRDAAFELSQLSIAQVCTSLLPLLTHVLSTIPTDTSHRYRPILRTHALGTRMHALGTQRPSAPRSRALACSSSDSSSLA